MNICRYAETVVGSVYTPFVYAVAAVKVEAVHAAVRVALHLPVVTRYRIGSPALEWSL